MDILKDLSKFDAEVANTEKWALRKAVMTKLKTLAKVRALRMLRPVLSGRRFYSTVSFDSLWQL